MHKKIYEKAEALMNEIEGIGCDNLTNQQIMEMANLSKFFKNMVCIEKDYQIIEAMEKSDDEEIVEMAERYTDHRRFYPDSREGRSGMSRVKYYETKETHKGNSTEDKQIHMKDAETYINDMINDAMEMFADAIPEVKAMAKQKFQANLINRM